MGTVTDAQVTEIAAVKLPDLNTDDIEAAKRQVAGHGPVDGHRRRRLRPAPTRSRNGEHIMSRGKKYKASARRRSTASTSTRPSEAVDLVKDSAKASFDETVELAVRLGVDPRKADQIVRGTLSLPAGTGRTARVAVFAAGEKAAEARSAGADVVGADDLVARVANEGSSTSTSPSPPRT